MSRLPRPLFLMIVCQRTLQNRERDHGCSWVPSWQNRDLRQLPWHRHRMVQARTRIMNQLQAVASTKVYAAVSQSSDKTNVDRTGTDASAGTAPTR